MRDSRVLFSVIAFAALALVLAPAGEAQAQDVTGTWNLLFNNDLAANNCEYAGTGTFTQGPGSPGLVTGMVNMPLVSGGAGCPAAIDGPLDPSSNVLGAAFQLGILDADFGVGVIALLTITGPLPGDTLVPTSSPNAQNIPPTMPAQIIGDFSGTRAPVAPTLPQWAAIALLGLLASAGVIAMRRRQMVHSEVWPE